MGLARRVAVGAGGVLGLLIVAGGVSYLWAASRSRAKLDATYDVHRVDFPIPYALTPTEIDELRSQRRANAATPGGTGDVLTSADLDAIARQRAVERGKHLVESFYVCGECHGANFGGGVMIDDPMIGRVLGPNLTLGAGSRTLAYTAADWDRIVRHGVKPNGTGTPMPSKDFFSMSDRELSDIVSYIRSLPPVDAEVPAVSTGPLGKVLIATGQLVLSADVHPTQHAITHAAIPPAAVADTIFGKHLAQACTGCHGSKLAGGPIAGGAPEWPAAANLTPTGLAGWTYDDFVRALKEGKSKNGVALRMPMSDMPKYAKNMTETELQALWSYLKALSPQPTGQ